MIELRMCFAAEAVVRDAVTNSISVFNLLDDIAAAGAPFFMQKVAFVALWRRATEDPDRVAGRFSVVMNERNLFAQPIEVDFAGRPQARTMVNLGGLVVPGPGTVRFRIDLETGARAEYEINVQITPVVAQAQPRPQ